MICLISSSFSHFHSVVPPLYILLPKISDMSAFLLSSEGHILLCGLKNISTTVHFIMTQNHPGKIILRISVLSLLLLDNLGKEPLELNSEGVEY